MFTTLVLPILLANLAGTRAFSVPVASHHGPLTSYANHKTYTFDSGSLPMGLRVTTQIVGGHSFESENVSINNGFLELLVPGGQSAKPYSTAQVVTEATDILYASVRTMAILTPVPGVCNGFFFYANENQETDIEYLTQPDSTPNGGTPHLWFTNQSVQPDGQVSQSSVMPPSDATTAVHEYRTDWTAGKVEWFVDGVSVWSTISNVPSVGGRWMWNNWADGSINWSAGPPAKDAVLKIQQIDIYYNTA